MAMGVCTRAVVLAVMLVLDVLELVKTLVRTHVIQLAKVVVKDHAKGDASILVQLVVAAVLTINTPLLVWNILPKTTYGIFRLVVLQKCY